MTDHAEYQGAEPPPEPRPGTAVHRNEVVRLGDLAVANPLIEDHYFSNCLVLGPVVVAPLQDVAFVGCTFDGEIGDVFFEVPANPPRGMVGVIGLRRVDFYNCQLQAVGMIGPPELKELLRAALLGRS